MASVSEARRGEACSFCRGGSFNKLAWLVPRRDKRYRCSTSTDEKPVLYFRVARTRQREKQPFDDNVLIFANDKISIKQR